MFYNRDFVHAMTAGNEKERIRIDTQQFRKFVEAKIKSKADAGCYIACIDCIEKFHSAAVEKIIEELQAYGYEIKLQAKAFYVKW